MVFLLASGPQCIACVAIVSQCKTQIRSHQSLQKRMIGVYSRLGGSTWEDQKNLTTTSRDVILQPTCHPERFQTNPNSSQRLASILRFRREGPGLLGRDGRLRGCHTQPKMIPKPIWSLIFFGGPCKIQR